MRPLLLISVRLLCLIGMGTFVGCQQTPAPATVASFNEPAVSSGSAEIGTSTSLGTSGVATEP
jgi:hypothetical protein